MEEEPKMLKVDGVVVTIPAGERAYFITEVPSAFGKKKEIKPFEEVPIEERVRKALEEIKKVVKR